MAGESCGESLRLNYTDREHQIQEEEKKKKKNTSQAVVRRMGREQRGRDMEAVYARDGRRRSALHPLADTLGCPQTTERGKRKSGGTNQVDVLLRKRTWGGEGYLKE